MLRGCEGEAAQVYFSVFDQLIRVASPGLRFGGEEPEAAAGCIQCFVVVSVHVGDA